MKDVSDFCCAMSWSTWRGERNPQVSFSLGHNAAWSYSPLCDRLWCTLGWVPGVVPNPAAHFPL